MTDTEREDSLRATLRKMEYEGLVMLTLERHLMRVLYGDAAPLWCGEKPEWVAVMPHAMDDHQLWVRRRDNDRKKAGETLLRLADELERQGIPTMRQEDIRASGLNLGPKVTFLTSDMFAWYERQHQPQGA